jgi:hypothetical protein
VLGDCGSPGHPQFRSILRRRKTAWVGIYTACDMFGCESSKRNGEACVRELDFPPAAGIPVIQAVMRVMWRRCLLTVAGHDSRVVAAIATRGGLQVSSAAQSGCASWLFMLDVRPYEPGLDIVCAVARGPRRDLGFKTSMSCVVKTDRALRHNASHRIASEQQS